MNHPDDSPAPTLRERLRRVVRALRAERHYDGVIRRARAQRERGRDREWHVGLMRLLASGVRAARVTGRPGSDPEAVPLVMCLWNRPDRLPVVLDLLARQESPRPIRFILWNNNADDAAHYLACLDGTPRGALSSVELVNSERNIGGLARFVVARLLRNGGYRGPVIMLDDDQNIRDTFVADLLRDYRPQSVVAWWGFSQHGSYWRRAEIEPGSHADHAGTGGTVYDVDLVADDRFFLRLPRKFAFLEDQWMSFVAHRAGWRVVKGDTVIELVSEELNQYHGLRPLKDDFYHKQNDRGDALLGDPLDRPELSRGRLSGPVSS
ncbi:MULTISPECIES: hypothetical protein [unclassified Frondihabitans]|uniref:hypothetical protein n=1 Tax=unclassified Frondihabitans TaxID=2626248 RepID=UPI000F4E3D17|nr:MULTISPECIES: hypothetical protein [unclassified Frondihabitans]RPE79058.1 hypothetical protein EDF37_1747 [Frondihabitans sp. PhB153]RPF09338.1 hypothetical protein EDF39_1749 [Frondihabitans sp. PhB161]